MDAAINPYAPGAGQRPPELAGRTDEIRGFDVLMERLERRLPERGLILTGLRGVGKTVLINEFRGMAERRGWIVAKVEARSDAPFRQLAAQALNRAMRGALGRGRGHPRLQHALRVFKSFSLTASPDGTFSVGIDVEPERGRADTGDLETDLTELFIDIGEAAADLHIGMVLFVDEMQDLEGGDLGGIAGACHETGQRNLPTAVIGAGLPSLPADLTSAKSYAERLFSYRSLGPLDDSAARDALVVPASDLDVQWTKVALARVLKEARGYPYFLQAFGKATWDYAAGPPIGSADADAGIEVARRELDIGFYGSRWERATGAQRAYLRAMAEDREERPSASADVARRLGRRPSDVSVARDQLIRKGLVYAPDRGTIAFTVPGMAEFIRRQP
jgi:hypothetical protein